MLGWVVGSDDCGLCVFSDVSSNSEDASHACHQCICIATVAEEDATDWLGSS